MGNPQTCLSRAKTQRRLLRAAAVHCPAGSGEGTGTAHARVGSGDEVHNRSHRREAEENRQTQEVAREARRPQARAASGHAGVKRRTHDGRRCGARSTAWRSYAGSSDAGGSGCCSHYPGCYGREGIRGYYGGIKRRTSHQPIAKANRRRQGHGYQETVFPAQESMPVLRREDRRYQLQGCEAAHVVYLRTGQDRTAPYFGRMYASPAAIGGIDQAGAQHRADSVRVADLVITAPLASGTCKASTCQRTRPSNEEACCQRSRLGTAVMSSRRFYRAATVGSGTVLKEKESWKSF